MIRKLAVWLSAGSLLTAPVASGSAQQTVQLPARDRILTERLSPLFSVGREEGDDWELLAGVRQVAFDRNENLYVLDSNNQRVLVFDANGRFVRRIGKKGEGPGELIAPLGLTVTPAGEVIVSDLGRQAYSIFKTDGSFVRNVMGEGNDLMSFSSPVYAHPGGVVTRARPGLMMMRGAEGGRGITPPTGPEKTPIILTDLKTAKRSTMWDITLPEIQTTVQPQGGGSGQQRFQVTRIMPEFMPPVLYGVVPGGSVAVASEAAYRIRITNGGKVQRVLERPIAPKKVGKREQDLARDRRRAEMSGETPGPRMAVSLRTEGGGRPSISTMSPPALSPTQIEENLRNMQFMDYVPVLRRMTTDETGRIWIQRTAADLGENGPIDIITHDGRYIGTISNGRVPDAVSAGGRAAWIERDDMGVERVVVRRLPANWR